jgi:hypothetical protein
VWGEWGVERESDAFAGGWYARSMEMRVEEVTQAVYERAESRVLVKSAPRQAVYL